MSKGIKKTTGIRRIYMPAKWEIRREKRRLNELQKSKFTKPWPRAMQSEGEGVVVGNAGRQD